MADTNKPTTDKTDSAGGMSRRTAMKWGVATTTGVVVWNEPYIVGLTRRPSYAAAQSGPAVYDINWQGANPGSSMMFGDLLIERAGGNGNAFTITCPNGGTVTVDFDVIKNNSTVTITETGPSPLQVDGETNGTVDVIGTVTCS